MGGRSGAGGGGGATFGGAKAMAAQAAAAGVTPENMKSVSLQKNGVVVVTGSGGSKIALSENGQSAFTTHSKGITNPRNVTGMMSSAGGKTTIMNMTANNRDQLRRKIKTRTDRERQGR